MGERLTRAHADGVVHADGVARVEQPLAAGVGSGAGAGAPTISVVVPAHNLSGHIADCLGSLAAQGTPFHEVVVVNDGSTDSTLDEILAVQQRCALPGFQLVDQVNEGVSAARNAGLDRVSGDYVLFLDGDDLVAGDLVESVQRALGDEQDLPEMVLWRHHDEKRRAATGREASERPGHAPPRRSTGVQTLRRVLVEGTQVVGIQATLCSTEFLTRHGLRFVAGVRSGEDVEFLRKALASAESVLHLDRELSCYTWRPGSVTDSVSLGSFDGVRAYHRAADHLAAHLGASDHDVVLAARRAVVPRFMEVFVMACRQPGRRGPALLADLRRQDPELMSLVRCELEDLPPAEMRNRRWRLFRWSPAMAAWYIGSPLSRLGLLRRRAAVAPRAPRAAAFQSGPAQSGRP